MKRIGLLLSLVLSFSALAQDADPLKAVYALKAKYLMGDPDRYIAALGSELDRLGPETKDALLRLWVVEAIESNDEGLAVEEIRLCGRLGADFDFEVANSGFDFDVDGALVMARPGDRILHVLIREEPEKDYFRRYGWMITEIIPVADVCLENGAGKKPSDLLSCEKVLLGGTWEESSDCAEIRTALEKREKELGCSS